MHPASLYRASAAAGIASAALLVFNFLRRGGVAPDNATTQALAPLSATLGLVAITGLFLWHQDSRRIGTAGTGAFALNLLGLSGILGIEYIANVVFTRLADDQVDTLVEGPAGMVFLVISVAFLLGVLAFGATLVRGGLVPRPAAVLYAAGFAVVALRTLLPEAAVAAGAVAAAAGLGAMSLALWRKDDQRRVAHAAMPA